MFHINPLHMTALVASKNSLGSYLPDEKQILYWLTLQPHELGRRTNLTHQELRTILTRIQRIAIIEADTNGSGNANSNTALAPTSDRKYIISSLAPDDSRTPRINGPQWKFAPQVLYDNLDSAKRAAAHFATRDRPMYVLQVVSKLELAPPPVISTDF